MLAKGTIALVTGGSGGIGSALVRMLAGTGVHAIALSNDREKLALLDGVPNVETVFMDVTDAEGLQRAFADRPIDNLQYTQPYLLAPMRMMVNAESGIEDISGLEGGSICVPAGTSNERYMADYMARTGLNAEIVAIERTEELDSAYLSGRCDGYHQWDVVLGTVRLKADNPDDHVLLPEIIAAEPIGMIARQGDDNWIDIGNWVINALLIAEANGVTSENVDEARANPASPEVAKLLGATPGIGTQLGLDDDWGYNVIRKLGNTSQIWDRNLGAGSPYKIDRGMNALFRDGGVFYTLILD